jgi:D-3-phosphoglycerate dehydrogenase / 2-oxoglutarate reductase
MKNKVLFLDSVHPVLSQRLSEENYQCVDGFNENIDFIYNEAPEVFGLVVRSRFRLDELFLSRFPALRFIARSGSGLDNIDQLYCKKNNIALFNSPEGNRNAVAEHVLGLLLGLMNNIVQANDEINKGFWNRESNRGEELKGKTIGIIGYGHNGKATAEKLVSFGLTILCHDKYVQVPDNKHIKSASLATVFNEADVVSLHLPLTEETHYFADSDFFTAFRKPIYFLNIARGKIVDTSALVTALKSGIVKAAGLDVLEYEETSFERLFNDQHSEHLTFLKQAHNVILTPHIAGWTKESNFLLSDVLADKILNHPF